jgi:N-acetylglucosaminyldiphosphoundecaprenol N-acetyl-beta-D-mannosaminyltransferase
MTFVLTVRTARQGSWIRPTLLGFLRADKPTCSPRVNPANFEPNLAATAMKSTDAMPVFAPLFNRDRALRAINSGAEFIVADGMPLVWASRFGRSPIPERVAGSDLLFHFSGEASVRGYSLFLLGGAEGVAEEAAQRLTGLYPGLQVVGTACPPFREWSTQEEADLIAGFRAARPDFLITALTLPRGDQWLAANLLALGVPVVVNGGAESDFAAGTICRAPRWLRRRGLEWAFRLWLEPRRLWLRYAQDACFIARMIAMSLWNFVRSKAARGH